MNRRGRASRCRTEIRPRKTRYPPRARSARNRARAAAGRQVAQSLAVLSFDSQRLGRQAVLRRRRKAHHAGLRGRRSRELKLSLNFARSLKSLRCLVRGVKFRPLLALCPPLRSREGARFITHQEDIMAVKPIPDGYHSVTPYLIVKGAAAAIDFYKKAFAASEALRMEAPGGKIGHAEIKIGNSVVMLADEYPDMGFRSPQSLGGSGVTLMIYVEQVDTVFQRAIAAGGKEVHPLKNQFYGDRSGTIQDPFGHVWTIATHVEDIAPEEMRKRAEEAMKHS